MVPLLLASKLYSRDTRQQDLTRDLRAQTGSAFHQQIRGHCDQRQIGRIQFVPRNFGTVSLFTYTRPPI